MKKSQLINAEARRRRVSRSDAADELDIAVSRLIRTLRKGEPAELPGLGTIEPGKRWKFLPGRKK